MPNFSKIINDPLYGFITIASPLVFEVLEHRFFQRLRRIKQLGLSELVYPGAVHTRFHHALGAMHLMAKSLDTLRLKGVEITNEEYEAALLGILLHDIGHGPYSHTLEHSIVQEVSHEEIGKMLMDTMNKEFNGKLTLAIQLFLNQYPAKPFLTQLISGQLDMDRLDYLLRDSFFTGVSEGIVGADRIINMLNVHNGKLVVEEKGIYSIEKFLIARRLMYWQVYMHKTVTSADQLLIQILKRARSMVNSGIVLGDYHPLVHFLGEQIGPNNLDEEALETYTLLDDSDIMNAVKTWSNGTDTIMKLLCTALLNRRLPKIKIMENYPCEEDYQTQIIKVKKQLNLKNEVEASYFVSRGVLENNAYKANTEGIFMLKKNGDILDVAKASDNYNLSVLTKTVTKYYITYWQ